MEKKIEQFKAFLSKLKENGSPDETLIEAIENGFKISVEQPIMEAKEKFAKKGSTSTKNSKISKVLGLKNGETVSEMYKSGKKLATDLLKAVGGDRKKAASMLAFAANMDKTENVLDDALSHMGKESEKKKD
jgi:hypothetical protein